MITHQAALNTIVDVNTRFNVKSNDRVLALSSLSFDLSVYDIFGLLAAGGSIVLPEAEATRDPAHWLELLQRAGVTIWNSVPALMEMMVEYVAGRGEELPESLRLALLSGDWIGLSLPRRLREVKAGIEIISLGGATEASIWSIMYRIEREESWWRSIPYGRAMANQGVHVINELGEECPDWVAGELYITGAGVAEGYWADEERTRAQFKGDEESGQRWYRTGDMGRWMGDGEIEFLGREDEQVKVQGHRIELGEVERALEEHAGVRQAVAVAQGGGNGSVGSNKRLIAYVVLRPQDAQAEEKEVVPASAPASKEAATSSPSAAVLLDVEARKSFKERQPGLREINGDHPKVDLAFATSLEEAGETYFRRRTHQTFSVEPIALNQFAEFIGCLRQIWLNGKPKYRYGSGGGLYPVQTYLHVKPGRIEGLDAGAYYYHPLKHELIRLSSCESLDENLHWPANRATFKGSAFSIFLVAEMDAIAPMYGSAARDFCLVEAGMMSQLLETEGASSGVGLCQIGSLDFPRIRDLFKLKESHVLLHSLVGGRAVPAQVGSVELPGGNGHKTSDDAAAGDGATRRASVASVRATVSVDELRDHLRQKLPDYMIPGAFVVLDALPMSPNGKVDRKSLPLPEASTQEAPAAFVPPQTEMQQLIAKAIQDELLIERVGIRDNFFELGATSLSLVKVHHRLRAALQLDFPIVTLFRYPSIESLTENLGREEKRVDDSVNYSERASKQRAARRRRREKHEQET
jgi:SagB-type dehydrogenase family enzyme